MALSDDKQEQNVDSSRQRRGKRAEITSSPEKTNASDNNVSTAELQEDTDDKLKRSMRTMLENKAAALELHSQWRSHISRLSILAFLLGLQQIYKSSQQCTNCTRMYPLAQHVSSEVAGVISTLAVMYLLHREQTIYSSIPSPSSPLHQPCPKPNYSHPSYMIPTLFSVMCLSMHFNRHKLATTSDVEAEIPFGPPFFLISVLACIFMHSGLQKLDDNVELVQSLKKELDRARNTISEKKKKTKKT